MPSSVVFKDKKMKQEPKAKIKYFVKASAGKMKQKAVLIIREKPVSYKEDLGIEETCNIKAWCCVPQGPSTLKAKFEKNIYTPQEKADAMVTVINKECKANVSNVTFFVEQKMRFVIGGHSYTYSKDLVRKSEEGPEAQQEDDWKKEMTIDLGKIKNDVKKTKKKHGKPKEVSAEDMWQMQGVQPACHSPNLSNEYFLCVEAAYAGCICCQNLPDARMPFTIVPSADPDSHTYEMPDGFDPKELCTVEVDKLKCKW